MQNIYDMHDAFFDYLKKFSAETLSAEEKALIKKVFYPLKLRKRQHLLQAGNCCVHLAFIIKGAMRQYLVDDKGMEHTSALGIESWWMCDSESFTLFTPSTYYIDAWEDTEMLIMSRVDQLELMKVPAFAEMVRLLNHNNNMANQRRITSSISSSAEKRYTDFLTCHPELVLRFPQHLIASYLGITKDTLSRIKRNLARK